MIRLYHYFKKFNYDRVLGPFFCTIFPCVSLHGVMEYQETGTSIYFLRDVINISVLILITILFFFSILKKKDLIVISLYTVEFAIIYTFVAGYFDPNFVFESNFIHVQLVFATIIFAAGTLIDIKHMLVLNILNILFIICCSLTVGKDYMVTRLVFYGLMVSGGGFIAYAGQKFVYSLFKKIKSARALIEEQNEELKKVNASKDQLFRIIGHDLRTPFHQLNHLIDFMEESSDQEQKQEYARLIKQSASKGTALLEDLLLWSKNIDEIEVELEEMPIAQVVDNTFEFFKFNCGLKQIHLINELPKDLKLRISDSMMDTVFRNLIGNAIKFSHNNSKIVVESRIKDDYIDICVKDEGVGICSERMKILLSDDKTISTTGTNNEKGTGYGLGIVKKLVERQRGSFAINSKSEEGTTITLTFPIMVA